MQCLKGEEMGEKNMIKKYSNVEAVDILHQIAYLYTNTKTSHDYGTGEDYTSVEVHTLKQIADNPGITVTEMAVNYGKTKGAISQILKKLEEKGLVYRNSDPYNDNKALLYITEKGKLLDEIHRKYDEEYFSKSLNPVREMFSDEEVDIAFSVLEAWLDVRRDIQRDRMKLKEQKRKEQRKQRAGHVCGIEES